MDVAEFRRLSVRIVAARNVETRAFIEAFDLAPGTIAGWTEQSSADWRLWSRANDALRTSVAELEAFLGLGGWAG
jgi:hypothetical protein